MKNRIRALGYFILLTAFFLGAAMQAASESPFLPGITVDDEHPNGCVDCHKDAGGGNDYRLTVGLKSNYEKHPDIGMIVKEAPGGCAMCHTDGSPAGALSMIVHKPHYENPAENQFITNYQGACLQCHTLDSGTGKMGMKSGPKNW